MPPRLRANPGHRPRRWYRERVLAESRPSVSLRRAWGEDIDVRFDSARPLGLAHGNRDPVADRFGGVGADRRPAGPSATRLAIIAGGPAAEL